MTDFIKKDTVIRVLGAIVGVVFLSLATWVLTTVYNNSTNIAQLLDKSAQDKAQWEAIKELRKFHYDLGSPAFDKQ